MHRGGDVGGVCQLNRVLVSAMCTTKRFDAVWVGSEVDTYSRCNLLRKATNVWEVIVSLTPTCVMCGIVMQRGRAGMWHNGKNRWNHGMKW